MAKTTGNRARYTDWKTLRKDFEAAGGRVAEGGKHLKWLCPNGAMVTSSRSASDKRAINNHLALLRRNGVTF